ncbi:AraC family transcriptional regulator [Paenibacillus sp. MER 180]|uniref:helix-turn-helix transcriptional regulator n=1 Tax=unclassified Paenibacillus TaxID=185978 RepID=UPI0008064CD8|nr:MULTISPECIES: AraC family transcriptional regulator [unclassified Paenibacillus]MCM3291926.1 AraC family transcriptional regulator [Paenibacillus sp. MER 180]OBY80826.1 AraC family transcriptional regulator [Paenibacillus sp. KS1]
MRHWSFGSGTFRKIFLSYTAILIIPIIVFSTLNVQRNIMEERQKLHEKHVSDANRIAAVVDNKLSELKNIAKMISIESWLRKMMQNTDVYDDEFDLLKMLEIRRNFENSINSTNVLSFGTVIFPDKQQMLSTWGTFSEDHFFSNIAVFDGDTRQMMQSALREQQYFKVMAPATVNLWGSSKRVIPVLQSLEVVNHPRAVLALFIDSDYFSEYMRRFGSVESKDILITTHGTPIFKQSRNPDNGVQENEQTYELVVPSQESSLQYKISYFDNSVIGINNLFSSLLAILISIAVGTLSAFVLAKVSYRPLGTLLHKLSAGIRYEEGKNSPVSGSEYNYIEESFDRLLSENQVLQQSMQDYEKAAKSNLFLQLLKGYFADDQHLNGLKKFGIGYTEEMHYCTMLISFHAIRDFSDLDKIRKIEMMTMVIIEKVMSCHRLDYELFEVTNADKALILSSTNRFGEDGMMEQIAAGITEEIEHTCGFQPFVLYGTMEKGLVGISKSYYTANESLQYTLFSREHLQVVPEETIPSIVDYYYPTDWEVQLINNLKIGNLDTSMQILYEISAENGKRNLSEASTIKLVSLLMETLLRVLHELNLDTGIYAKQFANRAKGRNTEEMWGYVFEVGTLLCERNRYSNTSSTIEAGSQLLQYVNQNYTSADVSLKQLAEIFQMSVSKASKLFKEVTGINFYDYLCRLRIEMAKELLREKKCGIDDIARRVGYENVYSFKRAFTRYEGIKPDEYMESAG